MLFLHATIRRTTENILYRLYGSQKRTQKDVERWLEEPFDDLIQSRPVVEGNLSQVVTAEGFLMLQRATLDWAVKREVFIQTFSSYQTNKHFQDSFLAFTVKIRCPSSETATISNIWKTQISVLITHRAHLKFVFHRHSDSSTDYEVKGQEQEDAPPASSVAEFRCFQRARAWGLSNCRFTIWFCKGLF